MFKSPILFYMLTSVLLTFATTTIAQDDDVVFHLSFDENEKLSWSYGDYLEDKARTVTESVWSDKYKIKGLADFVPGISGSALKLDGFSSCIEGQIKAEKKDSKKRRLPGEFTVEAWVSLGAYPWNWAPVISIGKYPMLGFYLGVDASGRVGFQLSDGTSVLHECNSPTNKNTRLGLELKKWYHLAATYSHKNGMALYINGELQNTYNDFDYDYGIRYGESRNLFIGKNETDLAPSDPIRYWATFPSKYTLDGAIDEIKIRNKALSKEEVLDKFKSIKIENEPPLYIRKFPTVKPSNRFGANYTRLKFYPEWDNLWPSGSFMDVVVQFDDNPTKIMFWRGTRYSACLVTENGKWMADQSRETGYNWHLSDGDRDKFVTGCVEHMSDVQCKSSRVSIIENNDARVLVNWRYLQMDVKERAYEIDNGTSTGQWGNEEYYIYPDGVTVRKMIPGYGGWQETIVLNEPGTKPEDNIELKALTLYNIKGESKTYDWENGPPNFDLENSSIEVVNLKSEYKPYLILNKDGQQYSFWGEIRSKYSHFPWWNHWPVAQITSDGRSASAPDRASHSALTQADNIGDAALYGLSNETDKMVVKLSKSWNFPAELIVDGSAYANKGYEYKERAYKFVTKKAGEKLAFVLKANDGSPMYNLALVIDNFNRNNVSLSIDGKEIPRGKNFRYGLEYDIEGNADLIVWIKMESTKEVNFTLTPR